MVAAVAITDPCGLSGPATDFLKVVRTLARTSGELCPEKPAEHDGGKRKPEVTEHSLEDHALRDIARRSHPFVPLPAAPLGQKMAGKWQEKSFVTLAVGPVF